MGDYRSRSYSYSDGGDMQIERYQGGYGGGVGGFGGSKRSNFEDHHYLPPPPPHDFRSYSVSYASSYGNTTNPQTNMDIVVAGGTGGRDFKLKKGKSTNGSTSKSWSLSDPEFQRKKRVASYKVYSVEGKVKGSFRKSFRWLKDRYTQVVHGWW